MRACLVGALALAAAWSLRVGWADYQARKETIAATAEAVRWAPGNAGYQYRLAVLTADIDPRTSVSALERAVRLNPFDAKSWIALGLDREAAGNVVEAERCLLRAAAQDRQFLPRWTLANFYFRRNDEPRFWEWAKSAAEMAYGDGLALFRLCSRVSDQADLIDRLGIRRPDLRAAYVRYLMQDGRLERLMPAVRKLIASGRGEDDALLMAACTRLLESSRTGDALEIWNALAGARRIPFDPLAPDRGVIVTNGRFVTTPAASGFDWRLAAVDGVSTAREDQSGGLRLTFSGDQPEDCELLSQIVPLEPNRQYELRFRYRTGDMARASGLAWRVLDGNGREVSASDSLFGEEEKEGRIGFRTGQAADPVARIVLGYRRQPGTTRTRGYVVLREIVSRP